MRNLIDNFNSVKLTEVLSKEEYREVCPENYLPKSDIIDGRMFIENFSRLGDVVHTIARYIMLDKNFKVFSDSMYDFSEVPVNGYLIRLLYTKPYMSTSVTISYITDINNIHFISESTIDTVFRTIDSTKYLNIIADLNIITDEFYTKYISDYVNQE